ncbi:carboxypeptidase regulatory-like domain-containing protein [Staphylococcus pseudintermedius]|nr:carboxypeptidase regulatory-like domain-containing protein [Staphylococcus pseudintermedius]
MNNKISALLTNKHSKYSIRKRTVGTASLLIGATLVFGIHAEDAKAAENTEATDAPKVDNHQVINDEQLTTPATEASATEISAPEVQSSPSGETKVAPTAEETTIDTHSETNEIETTPDAKEKLVEVAQVTPVKAPVEEDISRKQEGEKQPTSSEVEKAHTAAVSQPRSLKRAIPVAGNTTSEVNRLDRVNQNVNDLIKSDTTLSVKDSDNSGTIEPGKDSIAWKSAVSVDDKVHSGDYFTIKYSDTIQAYGLNPVDIRNIGNIEDPNNGEIIALAKHDPTNHTILYTFTDYVDSFNNVKMNMNFTLYIDPEKIPESTKNVAFSLTVGEQTTTTYADITYKNYTVHENNSIGSAFTETTSNRGNQEDPGYYKQVIYVNPLDNNLNNANLKIEAYNEKFPQNIGQINQDVTKLKIYQVPEGYTLNKGYDIDPSKLIDVTDQYKDKTFYDTNESVNISLGNITSPFVVVVDTKFKYTESETPTLVQMATLTSDSNGSVKTGNALGFTGNSSGGTGNPVYRLGNYVWHDSNQNGIQELGEEGVGGVTVEVFDTATNTKVGQAVTNADGSYLITNIPNGTYRVEFSNIPDQYKVSPSNQGGDDQKDSNGLSSTITVNGKDNLSADLGIYKPTYKIGDYVWYDGTSAETDGIQNNHAVEHPIQDVIVKLYDETGTKLLQETKTNREGYYEFAGLEPNRYVVEFTNPEGYKPVKPNQGTTATDSNITESSNRVNVTIVDKDDLTIDAGYFKEVEPPKEEERFNLGDKVWEDLNKDGIQNENEPGIKGVKVTLTKEDGSTVETTTDENGNYKFTELPNGKYKVVFETLEGYEATKVNVGDTALDSDGQTVEVVIDNKDDMSIDSGFHKPEEVEPPKEERFNLGDKVWEDLNKDGIQNENEPGIKGVKVTLTKEDGSTVETTTDENGNYKFTELPNGKYKVVFETPEGYEPTKVNVGDTALDSDGQTVEVVIDNKDDMTIDSGFHKPEEVEPPKEERFNLGDKVWEDLNKDGIQNENEPGIKGVKVTLTKEDGSTVETTTDENGNYKFTELPNGKYKVVFETLEGYEATKVNVGDTALDSDGQTVEVVIDNKDDMTIDSGFHKPEEVEPPKEERFNLGDKVWEDLNKDGIQNENEPGIKGVKVTLTKEDGSTVETTTDENGNYKFTELPNGKYKVVFETLEGYEATKVNVGDTALDSDGQTVEVVIDNKDDMTIDSGFHKPEEVESPKEERFNLGDKVWEDLNKDGIQNENEPGIKGVKVTLTKEDGSTVETTTDENGNYKFTELPNGKYKVVFETLEGYEATKVNVGDTALDSDGQTVEVVIDNKDDMSIDSGFHKPTPEVPEQPGEPETPTPEVPEQPGEPEAPAPNVPEQPGEPETPTPDMPEQPGEPEVPTPDMPEQPGEPEAPTPDMPEQPGEPEAPTPDMPEQPGEPEAPTPDMPEQPGEPEAPTPDMPEQPGEPEAPTPDMPEQPSEPKTPTPVLSEQPSHPSHKAITRPVSVGTQVDQTSHPTSKRKKQALPETGQSSTNEAPLLGGLLAVLGALFVVGRRKKQKNQ